MVTSASFSQRNQLPGPTYWVCVLTRNGGDTIARTMGSILGQTMPPEFIVVVDDGSTDNTSAIVASLENGAIPIHAIHLPDRGYDIRRVPANINIAYEYANKRPCDYSMIANDDCVFPPNYGEFLISRMEEKSRLVIASGDWGPTPHPNLKKTPQMSGRFMRNDFWRRIGGKYPVAYGYESWPLLKALQLGYQVANLTEIRYLHLRPQGSAHKFVDWGFAMKALGYHPLMVLARFVRNVLFGTEPISLRGNLWIAASYFLARLYDADPYLRDFDKDLRAFVRIHQIRKIQGLLRLVG